MFEADVVGRWIMPLETQICTFDDANLSLIGASQQHRSIHIREYFGQVHAEDRDGLYETLDRVLETHGAFDCTFRFIRPSDGRIIWISSRGLVKPGPDGTPTVYGVNYDVSGLKENENRYWLIAGEMSHRVKNLLSVVQGLFRISAKSAKDVDTLSEGFLSRLKALNALNEILVNPNRAFTIEEIVDGVLAPLRNDQRFVVHLAEGHLRESAAQTFGLCLNELMTNALKHGALSHDQGKVDLTFSVNREDAICELLWREQCETAIACPGNDRGFGMTTLQDMATTTLGGEPKFDWREHGLVYSCRWPIDRLIVDLPAR